MVLSDVGLEKLPRAIITPYLSASAIVKKRKVFDGAIDDLIYDLNLPTFKPK
jgi:hypothetical protein